MRVPKVVADELRVLREEAEENARKLRDTARQLQELRGAQPPAAPAAAAAFAPAVPIKGSPRSGPMPHDGYRPFDNSAVLKAFPGFRFKGWREGLAAVHARQRQADAAEGRK